MNQPEDRPPTGDQTASTVNRPAASDDSQEQELAPPGPGDLPPVAPDEASGTFSAPPPPPPLPLVGAEPPLLVPAPELPSLAPSPAPVQDERQVPPPPPTAAEADDVDEEGDDIDDGPSSRWASLMATVGTALVAIVSVQVIASVVEGLVLKRGQRVGDIPEDVFHRLGYPFGGLGATALVFLVVGVVLLAMPSVLDEYLSASQDKVVGYALATAIVMAVVVAIGSLLAVRANLHEYSAKGVAVPAYVRVQFTNFLLGALGAAALALYAAIATMNERGRERDLT